MAQGRLVDSRDGSVGRPFEAAYGGLRNIERVKGTRVRRVAQARRRNRHEIKQALRGYMVDREV